MSSELHHLAQGILREYSIENPVRIRPLGNHGGFSGACLWRVTGEMGELCLRAWPREMTPLRLTFVHALMSLGRAGELGVIPEIVLTTSGTTFVEGNGRLWELVRWLPGAADFHQNPSTSRLEQACTMLARLHAIWVQSPMACRGKASAIQRRYAGVERWRRLGRTGWRLPEHADPIARRAWRVADLWLDRTLEWLAPFEHLELGTHPCLCDVWHDHLLFEGDRLTGLLDYGAVRVDTPAVDLARMLGSLVEDDPERWQTGLAAYRQVRPLGTEEEALARALDRSGVVIGITNWLRWLYHDGRAFDDRLAAIDRLHVLVQRVEKW